MRRFALVTTYLCVSGESIFPDTTQEILARDFPDDRAKTWTAGITGPGLATNSACAAPSLCPIAHIAQTFIS